MLDPEFEKIVALLAMGPRWETLEPTALRILVNASRSPAPLIPGVSVTDIEAMGATGPLTARLYVPEGAPATGPGLIFFHGGGWVIGDLESRDPLCRRLARGSGVRIISVSYRLSPEHKFPAAHDDALAATNWVFEHAATLGFDPERVAIGGDSAGANMAASVCLDLRSSPGRRLRFQLLFYPTTQINDQTPSRGQLAEGYFLTAPMLEYFMDQYFADPADRRDPRVDLTPRRDLAGVPPAFLSVGEYDMLRDENRLFAEKLAEAGVPTEYREYAGLIHGFYSFADFVPAVVPAFEDAERALARALA